MASPNPIPLDEHRSRAKTTYARLKAAYFPVGSNLPAEYLTPTAQDRPHASLWPYAGLVGALNALAVLPGEQQTYEADLRAALAGFEDYHDTQATPSGYDSYVRAEGGGQKYYDDNEWVGLEFVRAYQLLREPAYLAAAEGAFRFAASGWSEAMDGGIYWRQGDDATKNTCSNAPAAVLALQLYQASGKSEYLEWGQRILEWLKPFQSPQHGVYWDNQAKDGSIDQHTYTYNSGAVLHAYALLSAITGESRHLQTAHELVHATVRHFAPDSLFPATPWFNAVLFRGYQALRKIDASAAQVGIDAMDQYLETAWKRARGADGLFTPDARRGAGRDDPHRWILDQAGMVELYALAAC